ncbi:MAG: hypothetical protein JWM11_6566 [Planctomycetaceae bacterium]|nr:hypothetical protein [Planctomycetaceae bacterium]
MRFTMNLTWMRMVVCTIMMSVAVGCGGVGSPGTPVAVKGKITFDGQPLANASIGFTAISKDIPVQYRYAASEIDSQGNYSIESVYPAEYMVSLNQGPDPDEEAKVVNAVAGNGKLGEYANNSPLRANVSADKTIWNFDVVSGK